MLASRRPRDLTRNDVDRSPSFAQIIAAFTPPSGQRVGVLFDAYDLCPAVTKACQQRGFCWFSVASRNRKLECKGRQGQIGDLGPGLLGHQGQRVRMRRSRGWRWMCIAAVNGRLSKIGTVRGVYTKRPRERWKNMVTIVAHGAEMSAQTVIADYERDRVIEVLSKELQRTFGLGECQVQKRQGTLPHLHLCALAHLGLTHHAFGAVGAQAKQANKDVPLPRFQERLDALRREIREENIDRFVRRIRHDNIRRRLRRHLLAA